MISLISTRPLPHAHLNLRQRLLLARSIRQQRRALARLDANQLRDIGLTAEAAQNEAKRPVWDVPQNWRQ